MIGDKLAAGARSAQFATGPEGVPRKSPHEVDVQHAAAVFGECRDCGAVAYSALEFSDHVRVCPADEHATLGAC